MQKPAAFLMLVLFAALVWFVWPELEADRNAGLQQQALEQSSAAEPQLGEPPVEDLAEPEPAVTRRRAAIEQPEPQVVVAAAPNEGALAELRGRFLLPGGLPASGVQLDLRGWTANDERALEHGEPRDWHDPEPQLTDRDGRFSIRLDPPRAYQFLLDATLEGFGKQSWRWAELAPGEPRDIGEVTLLRAGEVTVRLVDRHGERISTVGWQVVGTAGRTDFETGKYNTRVTAHETDEDGLFHLHGLPVGPIQLKARSNLAGWVEGPSARLRGDEVLEAKISYNGPALDQRLIVSVFSEPFYTENHDIESLRLLRGGVVVSQARKLEDSSQSYTFRNLEQASYTLEIEDRRFEPWSKSGVELGSKLDAHLVGNAAVLLEVVDDASGQSLTDYALTIRLDESNWRPNEFSIRSEEQERPEGGLFEGLLPLPQTLLISAPGYAALELPLPDLAPNETRSMQARLAPGASLSGRFTNKLDGEPIVDARVLLVPTGTELRALPLPAGTYSSQAPAPLALELQVKTDGRGRFEFPTAPRGEFALFGEVNQWQVEVRDPVSILVGAKNHVELVAESVAGWRGHLRGPANASTAGFVLRVHPSGATLPHRYAGSEGIEVPVAADGSFAAMLLPAGRARISLSQASSSLPMTSSSSSSFLGFDVACGLLELEAGRVLEQDVQAGEIWPGSFEATVYTNGELAPGLVVELKRLGEREVLGAAPTDEEGLAYIARVPAGEYQVHLRSPFAGWSWNSQVLVRVRSAEESFEELDCEVHSETLTLLDASDGTPLANASVRFAPAEDSRWRKLTTDAQGRLELSLPSGGYRVSLAKFPRAEDARAFEWTAGGALPSELRLVRP